MNLYLPKTTSSEANDIYRKQGYTVVDLKIDTNPAEVTHGGYEWKKIGVFEKCLKSGERLLLALKCIIVIACSFFLALISSAVRHDLHSVTQGKEILVAYTEKGKAPPPQYTPITIENLLLNSKQFENDCRKIPTINNNISSILNANPLLADKIVQQAQAAHPIVHQKVWELAQGFLDIKRKEGTSIEKKLYENMNVEQFFDRLLTKRPLMFMTNFDTYMLRDGKGGSDEEESLNFENIGKEDEVFPFILNDYISYDELQISSYVCVATPTQFINDGARANSAQLGDVDSFEPEGIYVGLVGARYEKKDLMEDKHVMIKDNGESETGSLSKLWANFFGFKDQKFPTFADAKNDTERFIPHKFHYNYEAHDVYFDKQTFKSIMKMRLEPFILDANKMAEKAGKKAFLHLVGLGSGAWNPQVPNIIYDELQVETYMEILKENSLEHIANLEFSWFNGFNAGQKSKYEREDDKGITIRFSTRNPAAKLTGKDAGKLLIAQYAWDGGSYPGNEYWGGLRIASGDPAAACCSTIPELQNPLINPNISGKNLHVLG